MNIKEIDEARNKWWRVQGNNPSKMKKWQGFIVGHMVNFLLCRIKDLEAENEDLRMSSALGIKMFDIQKAELQRLKG